MKHIPRFYVNCELAEGVTVTISDTQMHHAVNVLRLEVGATVRIFNEKYGEWDCEISAIKKCELVCISLFSKLPKDAAGPILACCLINQNRMQIMLEKVTELGVSEIIFIVSQYTQNRHFNYEKARQTVIGASEQSGRMTIPKLHNIVKLADFLNEYQYDCKLVVGDESLAGKQTNYKDLITERCVFLVGPEGGFSESERKLLDQYSFVEKVSIGSNILRSETAAIVLTAAYYLS